MLKMSMVFSGTPNNGTPLLVSFPYYSHIFRDSYGSGMGILYGKLTNKGVPLLGVPENATENVPASY